MKLVAEPPEEFRFMPDPVPPVIDEGGDKVGNEGCGEIRDVITEVEKGRTLKPAVPRQSGENDDSDLSQIDERDPAPPALDRGKFVSGPDPFDDDKNEGDACEKGNHARRMTEGASIS